jgi:hypothetical protein
MPVEIFSDALEPENKEAIIWRFMSLKRLKEFVTTGELYFCRADLFDDRREGLAPEEYLPVLGLNPLDIRDRVPRNHPCQVDLNALLTETAVSPWAADETLANVELIIRQGRWSVPVRWSELRRFEQFLPDYQMHV